MYPYARPNLKIVLVVDENTIVVKRGTSIRLVSMSGLTSPNSQLATQDYVFDGGYISNKRYGMRDIRLEIGISSLPEAENLRQQILSSLRGKSALKLIVTRNDITREIVGYINGMPETTQTNLNYNRPSISIPLLCPDPYFYEPSEASVNISGGVPEVINNSGDATLGFTLDIVMTGAVTDPTITCGNGQYIAIKGEFVEDDTLFVSTVERNKIIRKNNGDYLYYTLQSTFFEFPIGESTITLDATSGAENMEGVLTYRKRYLGI